MRPRPQWGRNFDRITALIFLQSRLLFVLSGSSSQCGQPEVPENGHVIFHSSGPLVTGAAVSYKCDVGFILVGPEQRVCEANGGWSEHAPVCAINVALYKPATQSSTLYVDSVVHHANYSTDGSFDGICSSTKAVSTDDENGANRGKKQQPNAAAANWWRVDLLETYRVYAVELLIPPTTSSSSAESAKREVSQIEIYGLLDAGSDDESVEEARTVCYKHKGRLETNQLHTFVCQRELTVRYIRIVSKTEAPLQLCEVVVLSTSATSDWQCGSILNMDSWGAFDGKCFYGSTEPMPWFSASTHCQMNGASLVSDMSESQHKFLSAQARHRTSKNAQHYWLGLVLGGNREWTWINGKAIKTEFWSNAKSKDVSVTNMAYAVAMAQPVEWNWVPALQTLWYNWICQSKPRFCSGPGIPQNGGVMLSTQMYAIGASSYYYCNYGYVLKGVESRTCLENGTWSGRVPKCVVVDCGKVDTPAGTTLMYLNESTLAGSKVEYKCPSGQKVVGAFSRSCQPDGTWSDAAPKCVDVDCGMPPEITNGRVLLSDNSTKVGSISEWTCDIGFGLIGPPVRHCAPNGQWTPAQTPYCYDVNSIHAPMPQANGESWHHSSLMTGFVVAVVVLLLVIIVVLVWTWRKKKTYDGLSMSTFYAAASSQLAAAAASTSPASSSGHPEVLYAFPSGSVTSAGYRRTNSPSNDAMSSYYVPSSLNASQDSHSLKSSSATAIVCKNDRKLSFLSADDLGLDSPELSSQPFFLAKSVPMPIAPPFILAPTAASNGAGMDRPIFLAPISHDRRQMEKIINDIHLTLPARRRGQMIPSDMKRRSPRPVSFYHTVRQKPGTPTAETSTAKSFRSGAKTMGAAAGRTLNTMLTKVRRKLSEANFNLLNGTNSPNGSSENGDSRTTPLESESSSAPYPYPTLRISLADIVQQLNDANANRLKAALNPTGQVERPASPTASELFAFDDDENEVEEAESNSKVLQRNVENGASIDYIARQSADSGDTLYYSTAAASRRQSGGDKTADQKRTQSESQAYSQSEVERETATNEDEESKIYDLPPDASALIYGNLAKALLKQSQIANENIYETPSDAEASSTTTTKTEADHQVKILEQVGIEIVHTYC